MTKDYNLEISSKLVENQKKYLDEEIARRKTIIDDTSAEGEFNKVKEASKKFIEQDISEKQKQIDEIKKTLETISRSEFQNIELLRKELIEELKEEKLQEIQKEIEKKKSELDELTRTRGLEKLEEDINELKEAKKQELKDKKEEYIGKAFLVHELFSTLPGKDFEDKAKNLKLRNGGIEQGALYQEDKELFESLIDEDDEIKETNLEKLANLSSEQNARLKELVTSKVIEDNGLDEVSENRFKDKEFLSELLDILPEAKKEKYQRNQKKVKDNEDSINRISGMEDKKQKLDLWNEIFKKNDDLDYLDDLLLAQQNNLGKWKQEISEIEDQAKEQIKTVISGYESEITSESRKALYSLARLSDDGSAEEGYKALQDTVNDINAFLQAKERKPSELELQAVAKLEKIGNDDLEGGIRSLASKVTITDLENDLNKSVSEILRHFYVKDPNDLGSFKTASIKVSTKKEELSEEEKEALQALKELWVENKEDESRRARKQDTSTKDIFGVNEIGKVNDFYKSQKIELNEFDKIAIINIAKLEDLKVNSFEEVTLKNFSLGYNKLLEGHENLKELELKAFGDEEEKYNQFNRLRKIVIDREGKEAFLSRVKDQDAIDTIKKLDDSKGAEENLEGLVKKVKDFDRSAKLDSQEDFETEFLLSQESKKSPETREEYKKQKNRDQFINKLKEEYLEVLEEELPEIKDKNEEFEKNKNEVEKDRKYQKLSREKTKLEKKLSQNIGYESFIEEVIEDYQGEDKDKLRKAALGSVVSEQAKKDLEEKKAELKTQVEYYVDGDPASFTTIEGKITDFVKHIKSFRDAGIEEEKVLKYFDLEKQHVLKEKELKSFQADNANVLGNTVETEQKKQEKTLKEEKAKLEEEKKQILEGTALETGSFAEDVKKSVKEVQNKIRSSNNRENIVKILVQTAFATDKVAESSFEQKDLERYQDLEKAYLLKSVENDVVDKTKSEEFNKLLDEKIKLDKEIQGLESKKTGLKDYAKDEQEEKKSLEEAKRVIDGSAISDARIATNLDYFTAKISNSNAIFSEDDLKRFAANFEGKDNVSDAEDKKKAIIYKQFYHEKVFNSLTEDDKYDFYEAALSEDKNKVRSDRINDDFKKHPWKEVLLKGNLDLILEQYEREKEVLNQLAPKDFGIAKINASIESSSLNRDNLDKAAENVFNLLKSKGNDSSKISTNEIEKAFSNIEEEDINKILGFQLDGKVVKYENLDKFLEFYNKGKFNEIESQLTEVADSEISGFYKSLLLRKALLQDDLKQEIEDNLKVAFEGSVSALPSLGTTPAVSKVTIMGVEVGFNSTSTEEGFDISITNIGTTTSAPSSPSSPSTKFSGLSPDLQNLLTKYFPSRGGCVLENILNDLNIKEKERYGNEVEKFKEAKELKLENFSGIEKEVSDKKDKPRIAAKSNSGSNNENDSGAENQEDGDKDKAADRINRGWRDYVIKHLKNKLKNAKNGQDSDSNNPNSETGLGSGAIQQNQNGQMPLGAMNYGGVGAGNFAPVILVRNDGKGGHERRITLPDGVTSAWVHVDPSEMVGNDAIRMGDKIFEVKNAGGNSGQGNGFNPSSSANPYQNMSPDVQQILAQKDKEMEELKKMVSDLSSKIANQNGNSTSNDASSKQDAIKKASEIAGKKGGITIEEAETYVTENLKSDRSSKLNRLLGGLNGSSKEGMAEIVNEIPVIKYSESKDFDEDIRKLRGKTPPKNMLGDSSESLVSIVEIDVNGEKEHKIVASNKRGVRVFDLKEDDYKKIIDSGDKEKIMNTLISEYADRGGVSVNDKMREKLLEQCSSEIGIIPGRIGGRKDKLKGAMDMAKFSISDKDETVVERLHSDKNTVFVTINNDSKKDAYISIGHDCFVKVDHVSGKVVPDTIYLKDGKDMGEIDISGGSFRLPLSYAGPFASSNLVKALKVNGGEEVGKMASEVMENFNNLKVIACKGRVTGDKYEVSNLAFQVDGKTHGLELEIGERLALGAGASFLTTGLSAGVGGVALGGSIGIAIATSVAFNAVAAREGAKADGGKFFATDGDLFGKSVEEKHTEKMDKIGQAPSNSASQPITAVPFKGRQNQTSQAA